MAPARDLLARFRPAGAPGAAAGRGVPADRNRELAAELGPVLSLLAPTVEEARRIRADAARECARRREAAHDQAKALEAGAHGLAEADRAQAALGVSRRADAEAAQIRAAGKERAEELSRVAADRMPATVDRVLVAVRAALVETRS
jgi:hypothetical protein